MKNMEEINSDQAKCDEVITDICEGQSHQDVMESVQKELTKLIMQDPLLKDLPAHLTLEEANSLIALEYGQAMTINVTRADEEVIPIIVKQSARVYDLKRAIKRAVELKQMRSKNVVHISWRYIWKTYWLCFEGQKLDKDHKYLKDYGIYNRASVSFLKRVKEKR